MPYANYDAATGDVVVTSSWQYKELVKAIPGARWDAYAKCWRLPGAWASLVTLRGVLGADLTLGDELTDYAWRLRRERIDPALALRSALEPVADTTPFTDELIGEGGDAQPTLYNFQLAGTQFLRTAGSGLLGDEMGCGLR